MNRRGLSKLITGRTTLVKNRYWCATRFKAGHRHNVHLLIEETQQQRHAAPVVYSHRGGEHEQLVRWVRALDFADQRVFVVETCKVFDRAFERNATVTRQRHHRCYSAIFEGHRVT
ncbi:hypothetical protein BOVATA_010200 [Babesia ovata]|uniref:Uncharacterized protein n=1 Tax=Babesia ovata TaxID=189622 RepID=A0A2H6K955_9APIC|nr:uncharacterized protein BOVATA_010200 [Babesia ovata]GBE59527.1 hypothetical protein BOVATA_010200 [Babesia ovata]